jgi:Ubiquitin-conjugating enzyme
VLRFSISFPSQYPDLPPLVTFATDIFHPLLVPLTTYTFSTGASDANETVSASDEERLPPGGFSLRDGFPGWFGRKARMAREMRDRDAGDHGDGSCSRAGSMDSSAQQSPGSVREDTGTGLRWQEESDARPASMVEVLTYIKSTFEDPAFLDKLPLKAAGNPGAWHAWRSYRGLSKTPSRTISTAIGERSDSPAGASQPQPGDWNWEGVWENRVKHGIENSLSDSVLFGPKAGRGADKRTEMVSDVRSEFYFIAKPGRYVFQRWTSSSWTRSVRSWPECKVRAAIHDHGL